MNRRGFLQQTGVALAGLAAAPPSIAPAAQQPPLALAPGPHLFVDDHLVERPANLKRVVQRPRRRPDPVINGRVDRNFAPYTSVLRDPTTQRFRIWYNVPESASQSHLATMESEDGVHWVRPHRVLADPAPISFGCSVLDEGVDFPDPARRFKLGWEKSGLWTAFSRDGLRWTPAAPHSVLDAIGDIVSLSWDPLRRRYLALCKVHSSPADGYRGATPNAPEGYRRLVGQSVSQDCIHWSPARRILAPTPSGQSADEGVTEFYGIGRVLVRGDLVLGFLKVLRDDLGADPGGPREGIGYTVLAWTRDGERWERDREPIFDRTPEPGSWDHAIAWLDFPLPVGDEVYLYYGGYARGHKVERFTERQLGLAMLLRDRYVARSADAAGGGFQTPPVILGGSRLTANAAVDGELRVRVLDVRGQPLAGFDWKDAAPVRGNGLAHPLRWTGSLAALRGQTIRLEFALREAQLFALDLQ